MKELTDTELLIIAYKLANNRIPIKDGSDQFSAGITSRDELILFIKRMLLGYTESLHGVTLPWGLTRIRSLPKSVKGSEHVVGNVVTENKTA